MLDSPPNCARNLERTPRWRPMEDLLLTRATLFASTNPCSLSRRDMIELVRRAGFGEQSPIMEAVAARPEGLIVTGNETVKELVRLAEARTGVRPELEPKRKASELVQPAP